jgi:hypothetical protein
MGIKQVVSGITFRKEENMAIKLWDEFFSTPADRRRTLREVAYVAAGSLLIAGILAGLMVVGL